MINPFKDIDWSPLPAQRRTFARNLAIGVPLLAAVLTVRAWIAQGHPPRWPLWLAIGGAGGAWLLYLAPGLCLPVHRAWHFLAGCVEFVVSNLLVTLLFYGVITPVGLALRLFGHDPMGRRSNPPSYWREAPPKPPPSDYLRQY